MTTKVRMLIDISGSHDGKLWPPHGHTVDLSDDEARDAIAAGHAVEVKAGDEEVETATVKNAPSKRAPVTKASVAADPTNKPAA